MRASSTGVCATPTRRTRGGALRCVDPSECAALDDACAAGVCDADTGLCVREAFADGTRCDDGDACTTEDVCAGGACGGALADCGADTPCATHTCNAATGLCEVENRPDGDACDDGDTCTTGDVCAGGLCAGVNTCCGVADFRLNELYGGNPDFMEVVNTSSCPLDIGGVSLQWSFATRSCGFTGPAATFTFASARVPPGGVYRVTDGPVTALARETRFGGNICDNQWSAGWVALCDGPCLADCSNYLDYFEKRSSRSPPPGVPACASFMPGPLDVASSARNQSANRVAFDGSGRAGVRSDWALGTATRD